MLKLSLPMRGLAQRVAFVSLLAAAIVIMLIGNADPRVFERARVVVTDFTAPILDVISRPIASIDRLVVEGKYLLSLREDNEHLRQQNDRLLRWQAAARELEAENSQLRELLNYDRKDTMRFISARVIGNSGGAFARNLLVNAGSNEGLRKGQAAIVGEGLIGRVHAVGRRSASILLITDLNSRIPVVVEATRVRAFLEGDNTDLTRLSYLSANSELEVGQRIVTSGHGGAFPPGLPVGTISSVGENGVRVTPYAQSDTLEYVRLLDFGLHGILNEPLGRRTVKSTQQ